MSSLSHLHKAKDCKLLPSFKWSVSEPLNTDFDLLNANHFKMEAAFFIDVISQTAISRSLFLKCHCPQSATVSVKSYLKVN